MKSRSYLIKLLSIWTIITVLTISSGCKKLVETPAPVTSLSGPSVYTADATAIAVMTGLYAKMVSVGTTTPGGFTSLSLYCGLGADELQLWNGNSSQSTNAYYKNTLSSTIAGFEYWNNFYPYIFTCNSALEGLANSTGLTAAVKQQLIGEAYFVRAFLYFYLVNLYGDVPMPLSSNYTVNATLPRTSTATVYQQIINDLKQAQSNLSTSYLDGTLLKTSADRVRPSQGAATALLARVYLYTKDWSDAIQQASSLISNTAVYQLSSLNNTFLRSSAGNNEAIWQMQPVLTLPSNTLDAYTFIIPSTGFSSLNSYYLSSQLLSSFEVGDNRKTNWTNSVNISGTIYYYPFKYKQNGSGAVTEHYMILRLAEQYLIRAEAEAQQNNLSAAAADLNIIRTRAGLPPITATSQSGLISAILHERQVEFFAEMGHRWLDLKRTQTVDAVMSVVTPSKGPNTWNTIQQYYPLPVYDLAHDPNLQQNNGY